MRTGINCPVFFFLKADGKGARLGAGGQEKRSIPVRPKQLRRRVIGRMELGEFPTRCGDHLDRDRIHTLHFAFAAFVDLFIHFPVLLAVNVRWSGSIAPEKN